MKQFCIFWNGEVQFSWITPKLHLIVSSSPLLCFLVLSERPFNLAPHCLCSCLRSLYETSWSAFICCFLWWTLSVLHAHLFAHLCFPPSLRIREYFDPSHDTELEKVCLFLIVWIRCQYVYMMTAAFPCALLKVDPCLSELFTVLGNGAGWFQVLSNIVLVVHVIGLMV